MRNARWLRIGPIARLSLGLVALIVSLVMVADMLLGVVPEFGKSEREARRRIAENLVIQIGTLLEAGNTVALNRTLQQVLARDPGIASITVRRKDGLLALHRGQPVASAAAAADSADFAGDANRLRIPIFAGKEVWGEVDLRFTPDAGSSAGLVDRPWFQLLGALALGGFVLCYAYLRRAMQYLNPSASVPDRVRKAFDSLAEGLVIVDQRARIVLANRAFRHLHPKADSELNGQPIDSLEWLTQAVNAGADGTAAPAWRRTLQGGEAVDAIPLELPLPDGSAAHLLVSSSAITDGSGRARGCLITFDNVTAVHTANAELRSALEQLESSRQRVAEQNNELRRLALRDPLTGCYNRRALFELAGDFFSLALNARQPLCCLMVDIDHFKQFNDLYGHAVGDQVIQVVSRLLTECLRENDVLGRYGGEEFCIVLPATGSRQALEIGELMRARIETVARQAVVGVEVMPITSSFGVASLSAAAQSIEGLIDQADQALYVSKQTGRNRVTLWQPPTPSFTRPAELAEA